MDLAGRLADAPAPTVTVLPDGSVDRRFGVLDSERATLSRASFVASLSAGRRSFVTEPRGVEPGGQAVNAAMQAGALGADVDLYAHLDHEVFDGLGVAATSLGEPADVNVYEFDDGAVMLTVESRDVREWSFGEFADAGGVAALDADAVVWTNWASTRRGTTALRDAADRAPAGRGGARPFVVDPGPVTVRPPSDRRSFLDALAALTAAYDVVVSANDEELDALAAAFDGDTSSTAAAAAAVRDRVGATAVVMHGDAAAVAVTGEGAVRVPNYETATIERFTGGGDRFTAALAFGRACGWAWRPALALGNAAATHYVATGETGGRAELAAYANRPGSSRGRNG